MRELGEAVDVFMEENKFYNLEGRRGVTALCTLLQVIGYKDPQYFGQLSPKASIGDLITFLEDNSGAMEAMLDWIKQQDVSEWREKLHNCLPEIEDDENDG